MGSLTSLIKKINTLAARRCPFFLFVDFEMNQPLLIETRDLSSASIFISFPTFNNISNLNAGTVQSEIKSVAAPDFENYKRGFDLVMKNLRYGNSFLTNYTCQTEIETAQSFREIFTAAHSKYKICFKDRWLCFSPEPFIRITNGTIFSFPMKGTINADIPGARQIILNDEKEIAEHYTIVDLIRNDLSLVAAAVQVEAFRYIEEVKTQKGALLQVSSRITGRLPRNFHNTLGEVLFALLPAGSVSGAPKAKTIEIIKEAENYKRGYYSGVAFYFDGENIDSCVLIRFIERIDHKIYYKSGGGITVYSNLKKEYQEVLDKIYVPVY